MSTFEPIAIVGQSCLLPGVSTPTELGDAVHETRDLLSDAPAGRWGISPERALVASGAGETVDRAHHARGGYVRGFEERFDPAGFSIPASDIKGPRPALPVDPAHRARGVGQR